MACGDVIFDESRGCVWQRPEAGSFHDEIAGERIIGHRPWKIAVGRLAAA
jgi:hypothetical protein